MTGAELAAAIAVCGYVCVECFSSTVRLDYAPALGAVPVIVHQQRDDGEWCPALSGGAAARLAEMDLLDSLYGAVTVLEPEPGTWHRRPKLVAA
jgi:hypothetical protein